MARRPPGAGGGERPAAAELRPEHDVGGGRGAEPSRVAAVLPIRVRRRRDPPPRGPDVVIAEPGTRRQPEPGERIVADRAFVADRALVADRGLVADRALVADRGLVADRAFVADRGLVAHRAFAADRAFVAGARPPPRPPRGRLSHAAPRTHRRAPR